MDNNSLTSAQLRWQCRRGMLELDLIFESFLSQRYHQLDQTQKNLFIELLKHSDQDLQAWIFSKTSPVDKRLITIVDQINQLN